MQTHLVTGGAGFIGSCYVQQARTSGIRVVTLDKLTYSGNLANLASLAEDTEHIFVQGDIGEHALVAELLEKYAPSAVVNFAAESHVDRSIHDPEEFVRTNVLGTSVLLRASLEYWHASKNTDFRFLHVSTDEVYGSLKPEDPAFTETTPYAPNSPYSATKAASDHLARAYFETYGFPCLVTNCSNNYGPRQFPEKLIPLTICNALARKNLPIYGTGENIRDWLHVEDHCEAIAKVIEQGTLGRTYNIGGRSERTNLQVVHQVCATLDKLRPHPQGPYADLITFVSDRPGHDWRYAINCQRIETELGWLPRWTLDAGIAATVTWYLENQAWIENIQSGEYRAWLETNYTSR